MLLLCHISATVVWYDIFVPILYPTTCNGFKIIPHALFWPSVIFVLLVDIVSALPLLQYYVTMASSFLPSKFITNHEFGYSHTCGKDNIHLWSPKINFGRNSLTFRRAAFYNSLATTWNLPNTESCSFQHACTAYLFLTILDYLCCSELFKLLDIAILLYCTLLP